MMVLDIQGVLGESQSDVNQATWNEKVQIETMGYDISQRTSQSTGTGLVSGGATVGHMSISKAMDKSTPFLWLQLCQGTPYPTVNLRVIRTGMKNPATGGLYEAETYTMSNVVISSYHTSGALNDGGMPMESWTMAFTQITETYMELNPDGTRKSSGNVAGFDFAGGAAV
jgi:type VI secretion system Hcp family effector